MRFDMCFEIQPQSYARHRPRAGTNRGRSRDEIAPDPHGAGIPGATEKPRVAAGLVRCACKLARSQDFGGLCVSNQVLTCWYQKTEFCGLRIQWFSLG